MSERKLDVFFSGRYMNTRQSFKESVKKVQQSQKFRHWSMDIHFTAEFRSGFLPQQYADKLYSAKLTLAPEGYIHSPITFRLFEAARAASIPISKSLPDTWYFQDFPGLTVSEWSQLPKVLEQTSKSRQTLQDRHHALQQHYRKYFSESRVAEYINEQLS
jgi:hypothetical protein